LFPVQVRHEAELDALGYFDHIHKRNPDAAVRFLAAIDQTVEGPSVHPNKG
jgi:plasmid stabilization system protein ParE